jgi:hypothetical protein
VLNISGLPWRASASFKASTQKGNTPLFRGQQK